MVATGRGGQGQRCKSRAAGATTGSPLITHEDAMIRDDIKAATVAAMKSGDKAATGTLRMVQSAIKNRDIEARTGAAPADDDAMVTEVLQKMIKQRRESVDLYRKGNRAELAAAEEAEIAVIERFLPRQLSDDEANDRKSAGQDKRGTVRMKTGGS